MTKTVRIENGDTSNHKVRVQSQIKNAQGEWAFSQRIMLVDAHGEVSAHLNTGTGIS